MSVIADNLETAVDAQLRLSEELAAIATHAFGTTFCPYSPDDDAESALNHGLLSGIRFIGLPSGTRVDLTDETEHGELLHFSGEVPDIQSVALARLAGITQTAMQQKIQLHEQNEHLARHAAQVSHDFDMLVSMRELAERMQNDGPGVAAADVVESLLPCLRDMLRASEVLFIETALDLGEDDNAAHLTLVHRYGDQTLDDSDLLRLIVEHHRSHNQEPVVLNDGGVENLSLEGDLASIIFVAMSASPGSNGWLVATRTEDKWVRGKRERRRVHCLASEEGQVKSWII